MQVQDVLFRNYLPYAADVIVDRALPFIDGLKPSQRRILFSMYKMGLLKGDRTKSTNIVGNTMKWHPHGDATIYDTMVRLSTGNETLNVPYIDSKGNFGKVYSRDLAYAASRYTEAKLAKICEEVFDGIDENAVDMLPNYDDTIEEPKLLPVKYPSILVNPSNGIAVGTGSNIPSYGLKNVCSAVIGLCDGSVKNTTDLVNILGIPEFTTGGNVHTTREDMIDLVTTGRGTITMTGRAITYSDRIEITELPYKVTAENIIESVEDGIKNGTLRGISSISDDIDLKNGLKLTVNLKRGVNPQEVLQKLMYYTPFCSKSSFNIKVIIDDKCVPLGVGELLEAWIKFRMDCIARIYTFRHNKNLKKIYDLESWEKIKYDIRTVAKLIAEKNEAEAKAALMAGYKLSDAQADYLLDMRIREFTQDRLNKHLKELDDERKDEAYNLSVMNSDEVKKKLIIEDQKRIIENYAKTANRTHIAAPINLEENKENTKVEISDERVAVAIFKDGYMKRYIGLNDISVLNNDTSDDIQYKFHLNNNQYIAVFCYDGTVYKILANDIDAGRGKLKDKIDEILGISMNDIMFIDSADDYNKHVNIVYSNGRGTRVYYDRFSGKRSKYKSLFDASTKGNIFWTKSDKFFMITRARKAAYCDTSLLDMRTRIAFKVARVGVDTILGLQPIEDVPDINSIDLNKYNKEYTVLIKEDELWEGAREKYLKYMEQKELAKASSKKDKKD